MPHKNSMKIVWPKLLFYMLIIALILLAWLAAVIALMRTSCCGA